MAARRYEVYFRVVKAMLKNKRPPKMSSSGDRLRELRPYWVKVLPYQQMIIARRRSSLLRMIGTVYAHVFFEFYMFYSCQKLVLKQLIIHNYICDVVLVCLFFKELRLNSFNRHKAQSFVTDIAANRQRLGLLFPFQKKNNNK